MGMTGSTSCFSPTRRLLLLLCLIVIGLTGTKAQSDVTFNEGVRYSQWVIDSRMNDFYANTTKCGFAVYDQSGNKTADRVDGKTSLDYVVGLVAKSIIEASQYYSQFTWAQSFAKPWFLSIQNYGNKFYSGVATSGGSLDDLNAVKLYLPLRELTKSEGTFEDNTTYSNTATALNKAITGLKAHNSSYSIKSGTLAETAGKTVLGGWWHKSTYENQMWLDGAYMGPALFAELVNYSGTTKNIDSSNDWDLIVKQFTILHEMCWNETDKLPYHAFAADGGTNSTSHSDTWAGLSSKSPYVFHSASYWGRAVGWYFLALVDILEQMEKANIPSTDSKFTTLKGYLEETAEGIKARQDQTTGGWYQILDKNSDYSASSYNNGQSHTTTNNYIESSATALFTAAYLKAIRLGYLDGTTYKTVAENGYKCLVNQFFSVDENGKVNIFGSCRSAGLGGSGDNYKARKERYRDGSKEYYLLGYDVAKVEKNENKTEGKVLGAFIMAATEYERQYQSSMLLSKDLNSTYTLNSNESLSVEVLGDGTPAYQWYDANTSNPIEGATNASYTPTKSGKYYCKITVTPPSSPAAKIRAASTSGSYTITTSTANVTVEGAATTYTVTFNAGSNGTCSTESLQQASAGASITLPNVTANTGYTFDGWYTAETGGTKIGDAGSTYTPTSNITLYAHYITIGGSGTVIYQYTVKSSENAKETAYTATGGTATLGADNKVDANGFKSDGDIGSSKYIKVDLTGNTLQAGDDIIIKAYSTQDNGGIYIATSTAENSSYVNAGSLAATKTAEELKYTVTETDVLNGLSTIYLFRNGTKSTSGKSTYIQEITITRGGSSTGTSGYTINYSTSVGTAPDSKSNITTLTADELPTLSATGYTFDGWYFDEAFTNQATAGATISAPTTLYAKWTINKYTVTATAENGIVTIFDGSNTITSGSQVEHGTSLTFTATPNAGYEFSSWSVTGTEGTADGTTYTISSLTQATTVTANFTATSSGGGETGGSVTKDVIHFTSGTTSSNEKVLKVNVGNATEVSVNYGDETYTNGVKMESSTDITLKLTAESKVTFVFDTASKKFKIDETSYTTNESGTYTITLAAGTYKIKKDDSSLALVAVDIQSTGPSMSISTQPESAGYVKGATVVTPLSVDVTFNNAAADDYDKSYLWYKNNENSTTGGEEVGTDATYTPILSNTAGTTYYYCVVTAKLKTDGTKTLTATSNVAAITVSEPYIEFTTQPTGAQYYKGETATALSVEATTNISGAISYKWYSNGTESTNGATEKGTGTSYTPSTESAGITYYYCVASVENGSETLTATSDIVSVEVVGKLYSFKVTSETQKPECNESWYITDDTENDKLVKMTFGGWKWGTNEAKNDHSYVKPNTTSTVITDSWEGPAKQDKVTALDGYEYAISGKNDAVHEDKTATTNMYGSTRYGWFVSPERENGITTKSYPYTLPVRGAYMTFEPTKNGTLTVYLLQNGAWNSDSNNDIIPGQFRMHAFQITNQRGLVLEEFAPQYKITVNQKVMDGYTCSQWQTDPGEGNYDETSKDISKWKEFWTLDDDERKAVKENWANGTNESQTIIKLKNGSFLAIQKAIVKYQFHVTGNETYYLFSNFSKLGFAGASFQPDDAQPSATPAGGKISTLDLSDVTAYSEITATPTGSNIEGTELKDYTYTIDGKDIAPVAGVSIPQFYSIKLTRTFKPNQWTTLTLPFNLTEEEVQKIFGKGTQLIQLNNATVDNGCAKLEFIYHEIQNVLPGHPYLIKPTLTDITNDANVTVTKDNNTITNFTVFSKCVNPFINQVEIDCDAYTFKGVTGYSTANQTINDINFSVNFEENDIFVSDGNGKMYVSAGSSYGKGYRAWFKYNDGISASGKINSISLAIDNPGDDDDNVVTTIDMVDVDPDVFNALGIATGVYNLNGQKVSDDMRSLPKGIYIVNGKKIVRK